MDEQDIFIRVRTALMILLEMDHGLLEIDANERSISHKLAQYLQDCFPQYHVDCEYNRHGDDVKKLKYLARRTVTMDDDKAMTVFPDIVIHRRRTDSCNLLVIEMKKNANKEEAHDDHEKLKEFTGAQFGYRIGLFLNFDTKKLIVAEVLCFCEGRKVQDHPLWKNLEGLGYGV